jgi:hypothetical protein
MTESMQFQATTGDGEITSLAQLHRRLYLAMQLEHATIPPYLTALYSIKPGKNPDAVHILRVIAVEEMLHLTLAANLLNAVGGEPDLTVPGFVPNYPSYLPDGETDFKVHIAPFSADLVDTFMKIERPGRGTGRLVSRVFPAGATVLGTYPEEEVLHYYSIGEFYAAIQRGIERLENEARLRGETIFTGKRERQVTSEYYYSGGGKLHPVTDLASALEAIRLITEQGEGLECGIYDHEGELSHYYRFDELKRGQYYQKGDQPGRPTGPTFKVEWEAAYPIKPDVKLADLPAGSELHDMAVAFNKAYARFLDTLTHAYRGEPQRLMEAVPQMFEFRNLMNQLVRNPLYEGSGYTAAPTFEIGKTPEAAAEVAAPVPNVSRLERFLAFSAEVTAFSLFDLRGTGQAEAYLKTADDIVGFKVVNDLIVAYAYAEREAAGEAREAVLRKTIFGDQRLGPVARNIVKLWYSGVWNTMPTAWSEAYGPSSKDRTFVVAPDSYVEGLLWTAIGAHPAGAKAPGYGSWAEPPNIPPVEGGPAHRSLPIFSGDGTKEEQ